MKPLDSLKSRIEQVLSEDHIDSDLTTQKLESFLGSNPHLSFEVIAKEPVVFCGERWVREFESLEFFKIKHLVKDGEKIATQSPVLVATSQLCETLSVERSLLNGLQRWSGVATLTNECVKTAMRVFLQWSRSDQSKYPCPQILHTRKTTPLWRDLEVEAVLSGGGHLHRTSLASSPMVKENHKEPIIKMRGEWSPYLKKVLEEYPDAMIEVESWSEAKSAVGIGAKYIMLDNFSPKTLRDRLPEFLEGLNSHDIVIEVSGGIHPDNLEEYVVPGVSRISMGALTHSYRSVDLSLNILFEES